MQNSTKRKPVFTLRELYADTFRAYGRASGTLIPASFICLLIPVLLIILMVYCCFLPIINGYEGIKYMDAWSYSQNPGYIPAWQTMLAVCGVLMALLFIMIWSIVLLPRFAGGMVIAGGNARGGTRLSLRDLFVATGGGRFAQLIVVGLCLQLAGMACTIVASIAANIISMPASILIALTSPMADMRMFVLTASILFIMLLAFAAAVVPSVFMSLTYPVAVCENKRHFNAVAASIRYVSRAFWRVCAGYVSVMAIYVVLYIAFLIIISTVTVTGYYWLFALWITVTLVSALFTTPFLYIYGTAAYFRIREADGYGVAIGQNQTTR